jgi:hypothetical protein
MRAAGVTVRDGEAKVRAGDDAVGIVALRCIHPSHGYIHGKTSGTR